MNTRQLLHIPRNYFRDKRGLFLLAINAGLYILATGYILLNVDSGLNKVSITEYRSNWVTQVSGPTSDLYQFAYFAFVIFMGMTVLSIRYYEKRRHTSLAALFFCAVVMLFSIVVFNALIGITA